MQIVTHVRLKPGVGSLMNIQVRLLIEALVAVLALMPPLDVLEVVLKILPAILRRDGYVYAVSIPGGLGDPVRGRLLRWIRGDWRCL